MKKSQFKEVISRALSLDSKLLNEINTILFQVLCNMFHAE